MTLKKLKAGDAYSWIGRGMGGSRGATWGAYDINGRLRVIIEGRPFGYMEKRKYRVRLAGGDRADRSFAVSCITETNFDHAKRIAALYCAAP